MRRRHILFGITLLAASCASLTPGGSAPAHPASTPLGVLVAERLAGRCCYVEGAIAYIEVYRSDGSTAGRREYRTYVEPARFSFALKPGSYRLVSYLRPCDASCDRLDSAAEQCTAPFEITAGATVTATIRPSPTENCSIEF